MPKLAESSAHREIIQSFFSFLASFCGMTKYNHMDPKKIIRLAGLWAFDLNKPDKDASDFAEGIACWSVAAEACYHLFLAYLRTYYPDPRSKTPVYIDSALEKILQSESTYPPPSTIYMKKAVTVPKVTLTVGRLSSSPFVLLQRISKIIQFEDPTKFNSEDDFNSLYFLFHDINRIEDHITDESRRVLNIISKENSIFGDHPLKIKDTVNLPYDLRCRTWSKSYNHALIDPVTGEPHRPLTNYVYEHHQRELIRNAHLPAGEKPKIPYPDNDTLPPIAGTRTMNTGSWKEVINTWQKVAETSIDIDKWSKDRRITSENLASCVVSNVAIDDYFIWLWMCSLSDEEDERRKSLFGRSIVVELNVDNSPTGRRWIIVEEVLHPRPTPMKQKPPPADIPLNPPPVITKKTRVAKKPVKFVAPRQPPAPIAAPKPKMKIPEIIVAPPAPDPPTQTIHVQYDNLDPLVAAVAKRLKNQAIDSSTQTDQKAPVFSKPSLEKSADIPMVPIPFMDASKGASDIPSISISPTLKAETPMAQTLRRMDSYEDTINSIPYFAAEDSDDFDYAITPIYDPSIAQFDTVVIPKLRAAALSQAVAHDRPAPPRQPSPPLDAEVFVSPILDPTSRGHRRIASTPSKLNLRQQGNRHYNEYEDVDYDNHNHLHRHMDSGPSSNTYLPGSNPSRYNQPPQSRSKGPHAGPGPLPPPLFPISASNRETTRRPAQQPPVQPQDEAIFDKSSSDSSFSNSRVQNPMFRPSNNASSSHSASKEPRSQGPSPPKEASRVPRDFLPSELEQQLAARPRYPKHHERSKLREQVDLDLVPDAPASRSHGAGHSRQKARSTTNLPSVDDMMFDSGPMRGGAARAKIPLGPPQHGGPKRQGPSIPPAPPLPSSIPTTYQGNSSDSAGEVPYGSDSSYRYDPHEKAKASPDPVSIMKSRPPHRKNQSVDTDSLLGYESEISSQSLGSSPQRGPPPTHAAPMPRKLNPSGPPGPSQTRFHAPLVGRNDNLSGSNAIPSSTVAESMVAAMSHVASISASMHSKSTSSFISDEMIPRSNVPHEFAQPLPNSNYQLPHALTHHSAHENSPSMVQSTPEAINLSEFSATPTIPQSHNTSYSAASTEQARHTSSSANSATTSTEQNSSRGSLPASDASNQSHGVILNDDGEIGQRPDTGLSQSSWKEIRENLVEMKRQSQNEDVLSTLPAIIEKTNPGTDSSVSPDEYLGATEDALRHPSLVTGDHVQTIIVHKITPPSSSAGNKAPGPVGKDDSESGSFVARAVRIPIASPRSSSGVLQPPPNVVSSPFHDSSADETEKGGVPLSDIASRQMLPPTESLMRNAPDVANIQPLEIQKPREQQPRRNRYSTGSALSISGLANKAKIKDKAKRILSAGSHPSGRKTSGGSANFGSLPYTEENEESPAPVVVPTNQNDPFFNFDFTNERSISRALPYLAPTEPEDPNKAADGTRAVESAMAMAAAAESKNTLGYAPPNAGSTNWAVPQQQAPQPQQLFQEPQYQYERDAGLMQTHQTQPQGQDQYYSDFGPAAAQLPPQKASRLSIQRIVNAAKKATKK